VIYKIFVQVFCSFHRNAYVMNCRYLRFRVYFSVQWSLSRSVCFYFAVYCCAVAYCVNSSHVQLFSYFVVICRWL